MPPPLGPRLTVSDRRLHKAQAVARVGRVDERTVVAPPVGLEAVDVHLGVERQSSAAIVKTRLEAAHARHPPRPIHEQLQPRARLRRLLADEVRDLNH